MRRAGPLLRAMNRHTLAGCRCPTLHEPQRRPADRRVFFQQRNAIVAGAIGGLWRDCADVVVEARPLTAGTPVAAITLVRAF
jgi:hypothetical protein